MSNDADIQAVAKATRAAGFDEFVRPILDEVKAGYLSRMAEIAATELNPKARAEKITALSIALKVLGNLDNGLKAAIESGRLAERNILNAREMEKLGREQRRLRDIVGI